MKSRNLIFVFVFSLLFVFCFMGNSITTYASTTSAETINDKLITIVHTNTNKNFELLRDYSKYSHVYAVSSADGHTWIVYGSVASTYDSTGSIDNMSVLIKPISGTINYDEYFTGRKENTDKPYLSLYKPAVIGDEIKYSNFDILDTSGKVFFSAPKVTAPVVIQAVEELPGAITPTVTVIVTVAVFCLALLIGSIILVPRLIHSFLR
jgi:hypothetical protein